MATAAVGAAELGTIVEVVATSTTTANGGTKGVTATCPVGSQVISGGFDPGGNATSWVVRRSQREGNGWRVFGLNQTGNPDEILARAYCLVL